MADRAKVSLLKRLLREPLLHFLALALLIFLAYHLLNRGQTEKPQSIVVTAAKIEQLSAIFTKTWQRPPTAEELKGLIDDYVKEEIYVREAIALGLDSDDTVIRRRLRLKMEFLTDTAANAVAPSDAELEAYLKAHASAFQTDPMLAFEQVFLNPGRRGDKIGQDAASILKILLSKSSIDPASLGDATLLPAVLPLTSKKSISQAFGAEFADALDQAVPGQWTGPVRSGFGLHFIRVTDRKAGGLPALDAVRDAVVREWRNVRREEFEQRRLAELLGRYEVTIESQSGTDQ